MRYPDAAEDLIEFFRQLPGVGRRGAERMVLDLLSWDPEDQRRFGLAVAKLPENIGHCPHCGGLAAKDRVCDLCADPRRDDSLLCVVENMPQLFAVEKGLSYRGRYLVLGGRLSPLDGEDGSHLNFELLRRRASSGARPGTKTSFSAKGSYCVSTPTTSMPEFVQFESGKSMMRYLPP